MCQEFYHILRSIKTLFTQGRLFYTQRPFFCALGSLFCALVREEAIFAVCKRCANEGFACMCKEKIFKKSTTLTLRSHTTGEFHSCHTGSILPSQFQKMIVRKLSVECGSKNYGTCFEHSRLRTKRRFVKNHMTC